MNYNCTLLVFLIFCLRSLVFCDEEKIKNDSEIYREKVKQMFYHAYDSYIKYAYPYDELQPLTCTGRDTWGSYSLTLIDSLDTLAVMKNYTEFQRVTRVLEDKLSFEDDINVSVFESNIRILGGLLSAHLYSKEAGLDLDGSWPCDGPLLRLAVKIADKLVPAFNTSTGMPFGTVNFARGVPLNETPVTCTAGVGTFIVEFGTLSRLTGNKTYENLALKALHAINSFKSPIGLVADHIDTSTGKWRGSESSIGSGIDSFFEYLLKGSILLELPELLHMFKEHYSAIVKYLKQGDWYMWAGINDGKITKPWQQSLETFWPGVQAMFGDIESAHRSLLNYFQVFYKFGALPEFYDISREKPVSNREGYPLRPELIESTLHLYKATKDPILLQFGKDMVNMIEKRTKTKCGYATLKNVESGQLDNRMESFFLAETLKYLYLLFDEDNQLNKPKTFKHKINKTNQTCLLGQGYIFNTEAHPVDISSLKCCQKFHSTSNIYRDILAGVFERSGKANEKNSWNQMLCTSQNYYTKILKLSQVSLQD